MKTWILWLALVSGDGTVTITPTYYDSASQCSVMAMATNTFSNMMGSAAEAWCVEETYA